MLCVCVSQCVVCVCVVCTGPPLGECNWCGHTGAVTLGPVLEGAPWRTAPSSLPPWNVMANRLKGSKITRWLTDWLPGMQSRTDRGGPHHYLAPGPASAKDGPECVYVCVSKCVCE